jgi:hypothetical protein
MWPLPSLVLFSVLRLFGYRGSTVEPAKWRKPQKPLPNIDTMVNFAPVPLAVLALLGFLLHRYF